MANQPISVSDARAYAQAYIQYMEGLKVDMTKQTHAVSFNSAGLLAWLSEVAPLMDELRIFLGVYTSTGPTPGRITTILWPYKNGKPALQAGFEEGDGDEEDDDKLLKPYNYGNGTP